MILSFDRTIVKQRTERTSCVDLIKPSPMIVLLRRAGHRTGHEGSAILEAGTVTRPTRRCRRLQN